MGWGTYVWGTCQDQCNGVLETDALSQDDRKEKADGVRAGGGSKVHPRTNILVSLQDFMLAGVDAPLELV